MGEGTMDRKPSGSPPSAATTLPINLLAEQVLLGIILADTGAIDDVHLDAADFSEPLHVAIFSTMKRLADDGRHISAAMLTPYLDDQKPISARQSVAQYVGELVKYAVPATLVSGYVKAIRDSACRRAMMKIAAEMTVMAADMHRDAEDVASAAVAAIDNLLLQATDVRRDDMYLHEASASLISKIGSAALQGKVRTGLPDLERLAGPLLPGQNVVLSGATGGFKSAMATQIGLNAAAAGAFVVIISQEMMGEEVAERLLSNLTFEAGTCVRADEIRTMAPGDETRMQPIMRAHDRLAQLPIHICQKPGMCIGEISAYIRRLEKREQRKVDLLIIDYLGLLSAESRYRGNKVNELGELSIGVKRLAMRHDLVALTLHQLNRSHAGRENKRPTKTDLRDSGQIENDADKILMTYREAAYLEKEIEYLATKGDRESIASRGEMERRLSEVWDVLEIAVVKNRNGREGTIKLQVEPPYYHISCRPPANARGR